MANLCKPAYDYSGMEREHLFTLCMTSQKYFGILCRFNPIKMQQLRNKFDWVSAYYFGSGIQRSCPTNFLPLPKQKSASLMSRPRNTFVL